MRVYVTGMGVVSTLGNTVDQMFSSLLENKSAIRRFPEWEQYNGLFCHLGATAPEYDIMKVPRSARRTMSKMSEMATLATLEALGQADLQIGKFQNTPRIALCMGSTTGSPATMETYFKKLFEKHGPEGQMGTTFFKVMNHSVAANVASALEFHGPVFSPSSACSTSTQAMILGWELIQSGLYDMVIAGGADELHYTSAAVFDIVQAASRSYNDKPEMAPRPFDSERDGLVVGEGASVVILESETSAKWRGARMKVELCGGAYLCNGSHMSQSSAETMTEVMNFALDRAGIGKNEVDYVNAHATGTRQGDQAEAQAIGNVFGPKIPVSSLKGHFGHSLSACGALEAIAIAKMMETGTLIPTRNLVNVDPECGGVTHLTEIRQAPIRTALSNNFAFGGMNASLVLSYRGGSG